MRLMLAIVLLCASVGYAAASPSSVWGRSTADFMEAFNAEARDRGLRLAVGPIFCTVAAVLDCDASSNTVPIRLRATNAPEALNQVRIQFERTTPVASVAAALHTLLAISEPSVPREERAAAVQRMLGLSGARPAGPIVVGASELRFRDQWRGPAEIVVEQQAAR
jgi:hypothetical protein